MIRTPNVLIQKALIIANASKDILAMVKFVRILTSAKMVKMTARKIQNVLTQKDLSLVNVWKDLKEKGKNVPMLMNVIDKISVVQTLIVPTQSDRSGMPYKVISGSLIPKLSKLNFLSSLS